MDLPSREEGPVESAAFERLASIWAAVAMSFVSFLLRNGSENPDRFDGSKEGFDFELEVG